MGLVKKITFKVNRLYSELWDDRPKTSGLGDVSRKGSQTSLSQVWQAEFRTDEEQYVVLE